MLDELSDSATVAARRLLGCELVRIINGVTVIGRIVETEAYDQTDLASHSYRGKTERTAVMFGPAGRLYVYFTYGMHYCCNVVVGPEGYGAAVLIRAIEPLTGLEVLQTNRPRAAGVQLTNGPAKLCQALQIDKRLNGHDLMQPPLLLRKGAPVNASDVTVSPRIGISQAKDTPWRFFITGNSYVSGK